MKKKKLQVYEGYMDQIEFGLDIGYFIKEGNCIMNNVDSDIQFHQFTRMYKEYRGIK